MASPSLLASIILRVIDRATAPIRRITRNFDDIVKAGRRASKAFEVAANMKHGADAVEGFSQQAASLVRKPIDTYVDLEKQMSKVRALTFKGVASEENKKLFAELSKEARRLGADTEFSASQAAQGMTNLATAGFSAREQIDSLAGVLDIAKAADAELGESAEISASTLRGFRLEAKEMTRVGDVLVNTFSSSQTTLQSLGEAMKYIAPVAAAAGVSLEKTAAMAGVLGDVGVQGSQAGTTLRAVVSRLSAPTGRRAKSALQFLGINAKDKSGNLRPIEELLTEIQRAMDRKFGAGKGGTKRAGLVKAIFGEEPEAGVEALLEAAGSGKLQAAIDANVKAAGTAARVAADMANNTAGAGKQLESSLEELQLTVGERLTPTVAEALKELKQVTVTVTDWARENPELVRGLGLVVGGVAALGLVVGPVIKAASAMVTIWGGLVYVWGLAKTAAVILGGAFKGLFLSLRPLFMLVKAHPFIALATAALLIYEYWEPISEFFSGLWDSITEGFKAALDWIVGKIEWAYDKVIGVKEALLGATVNEVAAAQQRQQLSTMAPEQLRIIQNMGGVAGDLAADAMQAQMLAARLAGGGAPQAANGPVAAGAPAATGEPLVQGDGPTASTFAGELKITVNSEGAVTKQELKTRGDPGFQVRANVGGQRR